MLGYGDLFKLMGITSGIPILIYISYTALKGRSQALLMHSVGWLFFLAALFPNVSYSIQMIFLGFSGVCISAGAFYIVYTKNTKGLIYLSGLPALLALKPLYKVLGGLFFSGRSLKIFMDVIHTAQYGYILLLIGAMLGISTEKGDFRRFGLLYSLMGIALLVYPFAKGEGTFFRSLDILMGLIIGVFLEVWALKLIKTRSELIIPEKTANRKGLKRVNVIDRKEAEEILNKFKSFPVLAFVREHKYPKQWNVYIITNTSMERAISPTNLSPMIELCVRYMKEAMEKGASGIVYINCLEYLKIYNSFASILKFLHALRDYAIIYNGTVIIEIEERAWNDREIVLLKEVEI